LATLGDTLKKLNNEDDDEAMADQDELDVFDEETKKMREHQQVYQNLFKGCVFFVAREVRIFLPDQKQIVLLTSNAIIRPLEILSSSSFAATVARSFWMTLKRARPASRIKLWIVTSKSTAT
jgi:hypothetical protein